MKKLICILLILCLFTLGCDGTQYYSTPREAYLASIQNKEFILTGALERTVELDESTVLWVACVDSLTAGPCLVSAVCIKKDDKFTLSDAYESDVSYIKLANVQLSEYSESRWEHTSTDTHDHLWQWVSTERSITTQINGATAYDYSFSYANTEYNVSLYTYSIEK